MEKRAMPAKATGQTLRLYQFNDTKHLHPIAVHVPNGMVPVAGLFMWIGCLFQYQPMVQAAFYNLVVIFLAMPGVVLTGAAVWQHRYKGASTPLFRSKIICSGLVFLLAGATLLAQLLYPVEVAHLSFSDWAIATAYLLLLIPTARAGTLGGKLVFGARKKI